MKIKGVNKQIKQLFFVGTISALAILKATNVAQAEEIKNTSGSAIEVESKENSIEEIANLQLKTEIEEAETSIAKEKLKKLEDNNCEIFAYKEFFSENSDWNLENDVIIAYSKANGEMKFSKEIDYLEDSEELNLEMFNDSEKRELFEIVKVKYTEFIESKDWKEEKKEEYIRIELQEFEKELGIYKTPTEAHFFTDIEDAEDATFWYELKDLEGKVERIYNKSRKLNDSSEPREKLDTPKITYSNTILACVEYTNDEGQRDIAYAYIDTKSKSGMVVFNDLNGLTDDEKKILLQMTKEKYEQILEENDKNKYRYIDKWDSKMKFKQSYDISDQVKRHSKEYKEIEKYGKFHIKRDYKDYEEGGREKEEKTETKKEKEDKEKEEKTETKKEKEDKEKEEKTETKKEKEDKEKEEKTETKKEKEDKEEEEKTETKKEKKDKQEGEKTEIKQDTIKDEKDNGNNKTQYEDNTENLDEEEQKRELIEEIKNGDKIINDENKLEEPFKKEENKEQKVSGEVKIGDNPPQKEKMPSEKRISIQGLREISAGARIEEINEWIDTLEKEVNQALEKLTNEKDEENEK